MNPPDLAPEPPPLVRACSWCQAEGKGPPPGPGQTHGICPEHHRRLMEEDRT